MPALTWALIILLGSAWPGNAFPSKLQEIMSWDKVVHAGAYGLLTILLAWGWRRNHMPGKRLSFFLPLIAIGFGILVEGLQFGLFPTRHFEIFDILANITGALFGYVAFYFFTK